MFHEIELVSIGLAAVIDTVLLIALLERRNWPQAAVPIIVVVCGAWMLHVGAFSRLLLADLAGNWAEQIHWGALLLMTAGVLLVPSGMAHGCWRLWNTGLQSQPRPRPWYALAYTPLPLLLIPLLLRSAADPRGDLYDLSGPLILPYGVWLTLVNCGSAVCIWQVRDRLAIPRARQFFSWLAVIQLFAGIAQAVILFYGFAAWPEWRRPLELVSILAPTVVAMLFGYFVLRYNFMQLMLERTLVYAAILVACMLFHHVAVEGLQAKLQDRYRVDFGILEALLALILVLAYQPLRQRAAEALRYLLGARVAAVRERIRDLSAQLSLLAGREPRELCQWFCQRVEQSLGVSYVAAWLFDSTEQPALICGASQRVGTAQAVELFRSLVEDGRQVWTMRTAPQAIAARLNDCGAEMAVRLDQPAVSGLLVFGRRGGNRAFPPEETGAVVLLVEQLGIMLQNSWLQAERLSAERRALQNEKLSTLGLLASSIAHEIKNPLSSIKTIAAVLAEDLGPMDPHAEDLRLILGEVDRLAATTRQLLSFVRPAPPGQGACSATRLLESTLAVMRHWARERGVQLESSLPEQPAWVAAEEADLREVFFNLLSNSIEAAGRQGRVSVVCRAGEVHGTTARVVVEIHDTGPGIPPEVQDRLFEPFVTTKASGTGLGLFLVGRRMQTMGGEVRCRSSPQDGTLFTIELSAAPHAPAEKP